MTKFTKVVNKQIPQVKILLDLLKVDNLVICWEHMPDYFHLADRNVVILCRRGNLPASEGMPAWKQGEVSFKMTCPTRFVMLTNAGYSSDITTGEFYTMILLRALPIFNEKIKAMLKVISFGDEISPYQCGHPLGEVYKDVVSNIKASKDTLQSILEGSVTTKAVNLEEVSITKRPLVSLLTTTNNAWMFQYAPIIKKIDHYEGAIQLLKDRVLSLEDSLSRHIQDKTRQLNGTDTLFEILKECPDELFIEGGPYYVEVSGTSIIVTIKDIVLSCTTQDIYENGDPKERQSVYPGIESHKEIFWYLGTGVVHVNNVDKTTGINLVMEGALNNHPHVSSESLCDDPRLLPLIRECLDKGQILNLCKYLRRFLSVYNPKSPYKRPYSVFNNFYFTAKEAEASGNN